MIYGVRHLTRYEYGAPVDLAAHMLHLRPRPLPFQHVIETRLTFAPQPARVLEGADYFGNAVGRLFIDSAHAHFSVEVRSKVDVCFAAPPPADATPRWEEVAETAARGGLDGWQAAAFLFESPMIPHSQEARDYAAQSFPASRPVLDGLLDLTARIGRDFTFRPGVTSVTTPLSQVLRQRQGVCQDFTHLMIAGLRGLGLPARYVSGYIRTHPAAGQERRRGADQSHAWVGAWLGPALGWIDLDPTNNLIVRDEHVVLAWGRDYSDISPTRGVILGGGTHHVTVSVDLEPVA